MKRRQVNIIQVGNVFMGGDHPIVVQSMTNTDTRDWQATVEQIRRLESLGCEIIRVAVPDLAAAESIKKIKKNISIPLVADIHFDHRLALAAIANGIDKVRINPGNIKGEKNVQKVVAACKEKGVPIRIGVNVGSLEKDLAKKYGSTPKAAVESCLRHVQILEKLGFGNMALSIKFSDVPQMIAGYRMLAQKVPYPLHLGVTHAGTTYTGTMKNAIGIGILLEEGIGSTLRVSLTAPPEEEIRACWGILSALKLRQIGPELISCPTCGRTEVDVIGMAEKVEAALQKVRAPIKVAVMGCPVNGPKEAKDADVGVAGGRGLGIIFVKGKILKKVREQEIIPTLLAEIEKITAN